MNELKKHYEAMNDLHYEIMRHTNEIHEIIDSANPRTRHIWMMMVYANDLFKFAIDVFDKEILPF